MILAFFILLGATILLIVATYTFGKNSAEEFMTSTMKSITTNTVTLKKGSGGSPDFAEVDWPALDMRDGSAVLILSKEGTLLAKGTRGKTFRGTNEATLRKIGAAVLTEEDETGILLTDYRYMKQPLEGIGTKVVVVDRKDELHSFYFQLRLDVVLVFLILVITLLLSELIARRAIMPVDKAVRTQQQFIADASHELKTPLTVILANLDILSATPDKTVGESGKWIENTKLEANRMSKLVAEMLFLARSDTAMDMNYNFRLLNFSDVVEEVVLTTEALAYERNITLESDIEENSKVVGDRKRLKQVVIILVENATKYVDEGGDIHVKLRTTPRWYEVLTVTNTGTPIPKEKAKHIFDRFYRVDESRSREKDGYGLGLPIAKKIIERHNGEISLSYSNEHGTSFTVRLPHAQSLKAPDLTILPEKDVSE